MLKKLKHFHQTVQQHEKKIKRNALISILLFVVFASLSVIGLINNSNGAVERYNKLIAADQSGGDVAASLNELREYIYSHMNTEIGGPNGIYPPIQLNGTYQRLTAAEEARVRESNDNLYTEAQEYCEVAISSGFSGRNRLECIDQYVVERGIKASAIDPSLYKYDFVAPRWSPDLAGFSVLISLITGLSALFNGFYYLYTRRTMHAGK